jgi:hypothetical protein
MRMCMTRLVPSTLALDFGGAPLATIQDSMDLGMGLDIDQVTPTPILAIPPGDRFLVPVDQAPVLRLQRMPHHNFSSERTR